MAQRQVSHQPRISTSVTVSTAGLSDIIDLAGYRVAAIDMSTAWTAVPLTFLGGNSTGTMVALWDDGGTEIQLSSATALANRSLVPRSDMALALMSHRYLQLRSGLSTAQSTQGAARVIGLTLVPA